MVAPPRPLLVIVLLLAPAGAAAQDGYDAIVDEALRAYEAGQFAEARALFERAHEIAPSARTLRGIGISALESHDYVAAARALSGSLRDDRRPLTDDMRAEVEELRARALSHVGRYRVRVTPEAATLIVDGSATGLDEGGVLLLPVGDHTVGGSCASCADRTVLLSVAGGEDEVLELSFAPVAAPPPDEAPRPAPDDGPEAARRPGAVALVSMAATLAVTSILLGALWWPDRSDALDRCDRGDLPDCINRDLLERQRNAVIAVTAITATGAIALGAVAAALFVDRDEPAARAVRCGPLLGGVRCEGRF